MADLERDCAHDKQQADQADQADQAINKHVVYTTYTFTKERVNKLPNIFTKTSTNRSQA